MQTTDNPISRIGIIGGSFNPVHRAHCRIAEEFILQTSCDICYCIPTAVSPFKQKQPFDVQDDDRLAMLRLAFRYQPKIRVSDLEIQRGGVSYTIDTIAALTTLHPHTTLFLLIGQDQAAEFHRWKEWELLLERVQLCIVRRPDSHAQVDIISRQLTTREGKPPIWIDCPEMNFSSTAIREYIRQGMDVETMLAPEVMEYIHEHHLYGYAGGA